MQRNCKYLLKNTTHHVITCDVSLQVILQLETLSEQRRKSKLCRMCYMTVPKCIHGGCFFLYFFSVGLLNAEEINLTL